MVRGEIFVFRYTVLAETLGRLKITDMVASPNPKTWP